jgi:hypothetical protein
MSAHIDQVERRAFSRSNRWLDVSRTYLNARPIWNDSVEFLNFRIGYRDATDRPIDETMRAADPPKTVMNSVDHDVAAGIITPCLRP